MFLREQGLFARIGIASLAVLSMSMAMLALLWGWTELSVASPRLALDRWERGLAAREQVPWPQVSQKLQRAANLNPYSATRQADLARVHARSAWEQPYWTEEAIADRRHALAHYRQAVELRPSWGLAWVMLAQQKVLLGEVDDEALHALRRAAVLSPFEPLTQRHLIRQGFALWDRLPKDLQHVTLDTAASAIRLNNSIDEIIRMAVHYHATERLRPLLPPGRHLRVLEDTVAWVQRR